MVITARGLVRQALFVMALSGAAHAQQCPPAGAAPLPSPLPLSLSSELPPPTYRNSMTRTQLAGLSPRSGGGAHHAGLTQSKTAFSVKPTLRFFRLADGRLCAQLAQMEASWKVAELMVDIAAEYRPGTCPYREVWEHENQHVAITRRHFAEAERALRARLAELAAGLRPRIVSGTADQAAREASSYFLKGAEPVLARYKAATERDNAAIDTHENYRRVSARCADW